MMDIFATVKQRIEESERTNLVKQLGYNSTKKGEDALNEFMKHDTLHSWYQHGFYDMKYSSLELFEALSKIFGLDQVAVTAALSETEELARELDRCSGACIIARLVEGSIEVRSWGIAMRLSWRHRKIPADFLAFKDINTILNDISAVIAKHYRSAKKHERFHVEDIEFYEYRHYDGTVYKYTTNGEIIEERE